MTYDPTGAKYPGEPPWQAPQPSDAYPPPPQQPQPQPPSYAAAPAPVPSAYPPPYMQQQAPGYPSAPQYPYGYQTPPPPYMPSPYGYPPTSQSNPAAIIGFICGLLGLLFFWIPVVDVLLSLAGIIVSIVGISNARKANANTPGLAIAGIVLGALGLVLSIIIIIALASTSS